VKTDPLGPDREGLNLEDLNLEESDHEEEDRGKRDYDLQDTLYSPPRQGDSILHPRGIQNVAPADQFRSNSVPAGSTPPGRDEATCPESDHATVLRCP